MRLGVLFNLIKDDLYHYRRMIYGCLFIPLVLGLLAGWKNELLYDWLQGLGVEAAGSSVIMLVLLVFIPYVFMWILLTVRLSREERTGFYLFTRTMPITPEETVTAKFLVSFVLSVGSILWFVLLWWGYTHYLSDIPDVKVWGSVFLLTFFLSIWLAVHHGTFFQSGARETGTIYFYLVIIFFLAQRAFFKQWLEKSSVLLWDYPVLVVGIGILLLLLVWFVCWRWAMTSYRRHVSGK